jgi:hypothetical protein
MPRTPLAAALLTGTIALAFAEAGVRAHHSIAGAYNAKKPGDRQWHRAPLSFRQPASVAGGGRARRRRADEHVADGTGQPSELVAVGMDAGTLRPGDRIVVSGIAAVVGQYSLYVRKLERPDGLRYEQKGAVPVFTPPPR